MTINCVTLTAITKRTADLKIGLYKAGKMPAIPSPLRATKAGPYILRMANRPFVGFEADSG